MVCLNPIPCSGFGQMIPNPSRAPIACYFASYQMVLTLPPNNF
uniref:Uncharacterized protein n=1 Tax=Arundo donax TaxID=35708 RepID=A0A0A9H876_ARUDO